MNLKYYNTHLIVWVKLILLIISCDYSELCSEHTTQPMAVMIQNEVVC